MKRRKATRRAFLRSFEEAIRFIETPDLSTVLGKSSTTQQYTHVSTDRLMQVYDAAHPKA